MVRKDLVYILYQLIMQEKMLHTGMWIFVGNGSHPRADSTPGVLAHVDLSPAG